MTAERVLDYKDVLDAKTSGSAVRLTEVSIRYALQGTSSAGSLTLLTARRVGPEVPAEAAQLSDQLKRRHLYGRPLLATWRPESGGEPVTQYCLLVRDLPAHFIPRLGPVSAHPVAPDDVAGFLAAIRGYSLPGCAFESVEALPQGWAQALMRYVRERKQ